jgi:CubicO group peptidase (beta-lactamase class C family)
MGELPAGSSPLPHHWLGGVGRGGQYFGVLPKLDLVVALNCCNYHRPLTERTTVARAVVAEVVLPSFVWSLTLCRNVTRARTHK